MGLRINVSENNVCLEALKNALDKKKENIGGTIFSMILNLEKRFSMNENCLYVRTVSLEVEKNYKIIVLR